MWDINFVQFTRLLNEINAVGLSYDQLALVASSMDVKPEEVQELLSRATSKWEELQPLLLKKTPLTEDETSEELAESGKVEAVVSLNFNELIGALANQEALLEDLSSKVTNVELDNIEYKVLFMDDDDMLYLRVTGEADDCEA